MGQMGKMGKMVVAHVGLEIAFAADLASFLSPCVVRLVPSYLSGLWGAGILGLVFAFGGTPCVGPIWASILVLAARAQSEAAGGASLLAYAAGLALALGLDRALTAVRRLGPWLPWVSRAAGIQLVALGLALFLGWYARLPGIL